MVIHSLSSMSQPSLSVSLSNNDKDINVSFCEVSLLEAKVSGVQQLHFHSTSFTKKKNPLELIMGFSGMWIFLFSLVNLLPFQVSESATVLVDGVSEWKNPKVQMGDSVIFQHKFHYNLYIFQNQEAFSLCNFTRATLLTKPNSLYYTWHTSRPGFFYFSFNNGSNKACLDGQKLAVQVSLPPHQDHAASPEPPPQLVVAAAPTPISGGNVASSRAFSWPFQPQELASPSPAPDLSLPATSPKGPDTEGLPFINSNPAVPLPTGEVDSATIRPLPASGHQHSKQDLGFSAVQRALSCIILVMTIMI